GRILTGAARGGARVPPAGAIPARLRRGGELGRLPRAAGGGAGAGAVDRPGAARAGGAVAAGRGRGQGRGRGRSGERDVAAVGGAAAPDDALEVIVIGGQEGGPQRAAGEREIERDGGEGERDDDVEGEQP